MSDGLTLNGIDLRTERERVGMTQAQLAQRIGRSLRTVAYWESGEIPIPNTVLPLVRQALTKQPVSLAKVTPARLSSKLDEIADMYEERAAIALEKRQPEAAERALRGARNMRRLAANHRKEEAVDTTDNPPQIG